MLNVVSVRVGTKFDPIYVDRLHDMVGRNLSTVEEQRHWVVTDNPAAIPAGITPIAAHPDLPGYWAKVYLFSPDMPWKEGERVLYMDLDCIVTGRLEELVERKGIIRDWNWPCFNSSVMCWDHGEHQALWNLLPRGTHIDADYLDRFVIGVVPSDLLPRGQSNGGDQEWITWVTHNAQRRNEPWDTFPPEWCRSYADATLWPPEGCKVVVYHGETHKPHLEPPTSWIHNIWKVGGYTELAPMSGMNVAKDRALANVAANIQRDVDWFTGMPEHRGTLVLVCGGPSMKDHLREIRDHKLRGAKIATVNNAMRYLLSVGIKPDHHIILDARPDNVAFLQDAPEGIRYFLASQVDPSLFDALKHRDVILWHNGIGDGEEITELCKDIDKPCVIVPGGCTVGLRSCWLAFGSGYRKIHVYGMDSSYSGGEHHAYPQALNDADAVIEVALGEKRYTCAKWMARQANDFKVMYPQITAAGMQLFVHGTGLIPDLWRAMRMQKEAA